MVGARVGDMVLGEGRIFSLLRLSLFRWMCCGVAEERWWEVGLMLSCERREARDQSSDVDMS